MKLALFLFLVFAYYATIVIVGLLGIEARRLGRITTTQQVYSVLCAVAIPPLVALIVGSIW